MGESSFQDVQDHLVTLAGSADNAKGVAIALSSSIFIGASFIIKKKGLIRSGEAGGKQAAQGGFAYLHNRVWWLGMVAMIFGETLNFVAYAYAPAILVAPLGAVTIAVSAVMARCFLGERLHPCGMVGIAICAIGTVVLVQFAPEETEVNSVEEVWELGMQPAFRLYVLAVVLAALGLVYRVAPRYGQSQIWVYILICSLVGSLSVVAARGVGIAAKLTLRGSNQLFKRETLVLVVWVLGCMLTQINYLNKALDTFDTTMVTSIYYVCFTVCTVTASMIMYKDWQNQTFATIFWQLVALVINVLGVHVMSSSKDAAPGLCAGFRSILGRGGAVASKPEYTQLCACEHVDTEVGAGGSKKRLDASAAD